MNLTLAAIRNLKKIYNKNKLLIHTVEKERKKSDFYF